MARLEIRFLGGIEVCRNGQVLAFPTQKAKELLAYLVVFRHNAHLRITLANLLWPESCEERARASLRKALSFLRKTLDPEAEGIRWFVSYGGAVRFNSAAGDLWLDIGEFERLIVDGTKNQQTKSLEQAIALYRGPPLPGIYADWALAESERIHMLYLDTLEQLAELYQTRHDFEKAITTWTRVLRAVPWHERAHRELMTLYVLAGDRAAALCQYGEYCAVLQRELNAPPLPEMRMLYEKILRGALLEVGAVREPLLPTEIPFVGREHECQFVETLWLKVCHGEGQAILIEGEIGVGKTSFMEHFVAHVRQPHSTLRGTAYAGELPYEPLLQAVREGLKSTSVATLSRLPAPWQNELARFVPELQERFPNLKPNFPVTHGKDRGFAALMAFFESLTHEHPLILSLDDLHWADEATLEYLSYLMAHLKNHRILLIGTYRTEEALEGGSLQAWLGKLQPKHFYHALKLPRLSREETGSLLEQLLRWKDGKVFDALYEETEGNPLFLVKLVHSLVASGALQRDPEGGWILTIQEIGAAQLPDSLRELIKTLLRRVPRRAHYVLGLASVAGRTFELPILKEILHQSEEALLDRLDDLRCVGLFVEHKGHYQFSHELVRQVVYEELGTDRRKLWHKKITQILEVLYPDQLNELAGELARHCERAGVLQKALQYAERAGLHAQQQYAYSEAIKFFAKALALSKQMKDRRKEGDLLNKIGLVHRELGQYAETLKHCQEALNIYQELGDQAGTGEASHNVGHAYYYLGQVEEALRFTQQALEIRQEIGDGQGLGASLNNIGNIYYFYLGRYEEALLHYRRALDLWHQMDDRRGQGMSFNNIGAVCWNLGQYEEALSHFQEGLEISREIGDRDGEVWGLNNIGHVKLFLKQPEEALGCFQRALKIAREIGDRRGQGYCIFGIGRFHSETGCYSEALRDYAEARAIFERLGTKAECVTCLSWESMALLGLEDRTNALSRSSQAVQILESGENCAVPQEVYFNHFQVLAAHGRKTEARRYLQKARDAVMQRAEKISHTETRESFLTRVQTNREILQIWEILEHEQGHSVD